LYLKIDNSLIGIEGRFRADDRNDLEKIERDQYKPKLLQAIPGQRNERASYRASIYRVSSLLINDYRNLLMDFFSSVHGGWIERDINIARKERNIVVERLLATR